MLSHDMSESNTMKLRPWCEDKVPKLHGSTAKLWRGLADQSRLTCAIWALFDDQLLQRWRSAKTDIENSDALWDLLTNFVFASRQHQTVKCND
jgi:hypothetical protein